MECDEWGNLPIHIRKQSSGSDLIVSCDNILLDNLKIGIYYDNKVQYISEYGRNSSYGYCNDGSVEIYTANNPKDGFRMIKRLYYRMYHHYQVKDEEMYLTINYTSGLLTSDIYTIVDFPCILGFIDQTGKFTPALQINSGSDYIILKP